MTPFPRRDAARNDTISRCYARHAFLTYFSKLVTVSSSSSSSPPTAATEDSVFLIARRGLPIYLYHSDLDASRPQSGGRWSRRSVFFHVHLPPFRNGYFCFVVMEGDAESRNLLLFFRSLFLFFFRYFLSGIYHNRMAASHGQTDRTSSLPPPTPSRSISSTSTSPSYPHHDHHPADIHEHGYMRFDSILLLPFSVIYTRSYTRVLAPGFSSLVSQNVFQFF